MASELNLSFNWNSNKIFKGLRLTLYILFFDIDIKELGLEMNLKIDGLNGSLVKEIRFVFRSKEIIELKGC